MLGKELGSALGLDETLRKVLVIESGDREGLVVGFRDGYWDGHDEGNSLG